MTAAKTRLLKFTNNLALKPRKIAKTIHNCELCNCAIQPGGEYRDGGPGKRAHEICLTEVVRAYRK